MPYHQQADLRDLPLRSGSRPLGDSCKEHPQEGSCGSYGAGANGSRSDRRHSFCRRFPRYPYNTQTEHRSLLPHKMQSIP